MSTDFTKNAPTEQRRDTTARVIPGQRRGHVAETKPALRTTEFIVYLASVVAVLIVSAVVGDDRNGDNYFRADRAWGYVVLLSVGYMISRGLAKSGSGMYRG